MHENKSPASAISQKMLVSIVLVGGVVFGFLVGRISVSDSEPVVTTKETKPQIALVELKKISGDTMDIDLKGSVRVLWAQQNSVEGLGAHQIPLGQVPNENDLKLSQFAYLGNAKTGKFYPSDSYPARGTEVAYRRFFKTQKEATDAGFVATKLVK